jgi:hypothetical protein
VRAERRGALGAYGRRGFIDGGGVGFGPDHAGGQGDPADAHVVQPGRGLFDAGLGVQRRGQHGQGQPGREQHGGDAGRTDRLLATHGEQDDAVSGGGDAEHPHPVGPGQPGISEPVVQRLGQQRVGVEDLTYARVDPGGRDGLAQRAGRLRVRGDQLRDDHRRRRARRPPGGGVGEHGADPGRIAPPALIDPRRAHVQGRIVHAEHGRDLGGGTREAVVADARHREEESWRSLRQAGGYRPPVTAARLDQAGVRLADREYSRRRQFEFGFRQGLRLERRVPGRPPGGEADREVGCVAHTSEA